MKHLIIAIAVSLTLVACKKASEQTSSDEPKTNVTDGEGAGDAIKLNDGVGLSLHPKLRKAISLELAEVGEESVAPEFVASLHVTEGADSKKNSMSISSGTGVEASGWVAAGKASYIQPGQQVTIRKNDLSAELVGTGIVKRVEKSPYAMLGDFELVVETSQPFDTGTRLIAQFKTDAGDPVPVVPRSALLKTAEGYFVYTANDDSFLRTPVKVGAMNENVVEITDGLYSGDQIVSAPVNSLWMAELQLLRGGKSCTCGH